MRKQYKYFFISMACLLICSAMPVFAGTGTGQNQNNNGNSGAPHSTPGLDPAALTGMAAAGYMGFQFLKGTKPTGKKDT